VNSVEEEAKATAQLKVDSLSSLNELSLYQQDSALQAFENEILLNKGSEEVYPVMGYTYAYCKKREINLGLDLQGGMHVTLEVSVPEMMNALAGSNKGNVQFNQIMVRAKEMQRESQDDFVTLFARAHQEIAPDYPLAAIFHNLENKEKISPDATNEEVLNIIRTEAEDAISRTEQVLRKRVDNLGVVQPKIQRLTGTGRIVVELPGVKDKNRVRKILQGTAKLEFFECYQNREIYPGLEQANSILAATLKADSPADDASSDAIDEMITDEASEEVAETVEVDTTATDSASEEVSLEDMLAAEGDSAGADSLNDLSRAEIAKQNPLFILMQPQQQPDQPMVGMAQAGDTAKINEYLSRKDIRRLFPPRTKFVWDAKPLEGTENIFGVYAVKVPKGGVALLEGDVVTDAGVSADPLGNPTVSMSMNSQGSKTWREMTREASADPNDLRSVAVVLDGIVYSAPRVQGEIPSGRTEITGRFTQQEAADLAGVLKAGKLPAPSHIIEEAVVGPSLGEESISSGWSSFMIALAIVLAYMIFYYSGAGAVADIALIANIFFIMGVLASLRATLTLPGIAGIVLTIGMSVDANVLIYERIREELKAGKGYKLAITDGYKNAYSSILDANVTTLLTGIILLVFGTGPIQGFATTLIIGIMTSLFSAIFITRLLFELRMESSKTIPFATKMTENVLANPGVSFLGKRKMFYGISGAVILIGIISLFARGLNYGVDFTGGRSYIVRFEQPVAVEDIAQSLGDQFVDKNNLRQVPEVKTFGASNQVKITTKYMIEETENDVETLVQDKLYAGLTPFLAGQSQAEFLEELTSQKVEPTIADDIKQSAVWAVLFSLIVIFLYILIRFRKWQYSVGALIAMTHDVLVVLAVFSILYGFLPFSLEIDQAFIAAILTVVGYSINDTVVVFDRIREYFNLHPKHKEEELVNSALNSTLSRTLNTSVSTFLVLLTIFIFGGEVIRGFVFALMVGVVVGTYSSLYIASPTMFDLSKKKA
jgi:SecD/SecF fusion protein